MAEVRNTVPGSAAPADPGTGRPPTLQLVRASKSFGHLIALEHVDLVAHRGETLAIVGDNGAGKSTLLKVLAGVYRPDEGHVYIDGVAIQSGNPADARRHGISTVFQDLALVETLDVAFNLFLGRQIRKFGVFADRRRMIQLATQTLADYGVTVPSVRVPVGELSGGQRQSVAIARAVREDNPIILLDEPTAALGVRETANAGKIIDSLKAAVRAVVVVTHDLSFAFDHCDRIQVMRLGRVHAVRTTRDTTREEIVGLITGAIEGDRDLMSSDEIRKWS